ncbi:MAG: LysM peptidoglycan-binding domain-containing protein [Bacteriovorax sp.]|nr:LysM peptidoglycan-binding domain-containing protein [Bacteriovorax sp.]
MRNLNKIILTLTLILITNGCSIIKESSSGVAARNIDQLTTRPSQDQKELPLVVSPIAKIEQTGPNEKNEQKNKLAIYYIEQGDTLMLISQKLLGNHLKWRSIRKWNKQYVRSTDLIPGTPLYYAAEKIPENDPLEGLPYLIKKNDTLPRISGKVYGARKSWDVIYFNNKDIIKSPDLIYSGLIIYYPLKEKIAEIKAEMIAFHFEVYPKRKPASLK